MEITRRDFVKATGATGAGMMLAGSNLDLKFFKESDRAPSGEEKWVAGGCNGCVGWCPLRVRVVDGKAVKITGNPESRWTRGQLCPRGLLNLQILYDADRVKKPLKRTNPLKGRGEDPKWVEIGWEEALNTVAGKLKELRDKGTPERFALFRGRYDTTSADIFYGRFAKAYGTPNSISHSALCDEASKLGNFFATGRNDYSAYDFEDTNYILSFGVPFLEANRPVTGILASWGEGRRGKSTRTKFVIIDPHYSVTASRADEWIPINPGTDGALALGIAHEILVRGIWDQKFVGKFKDASGKFIEGKEADEKSWEDASTTGLTKWWNLFLKDFPPALASSKTGIPEGTIKRLAQELAKTKPAIAQRGRGSTAWPGNGLYNSYAIYVLNALTGNLEVKGGLNHPASVSYSPEPIPITQDEVSLAGTKKPTIDEKGTLKFPNAGVVTNNAADNILKDFPYPIEVALGWWNNWTFSAPGSRRWEDALKKIPFMAHHTTHISEWSTYSDIVLPAKTYLEKWGAGNPGGGASLYSGMTLYQPVVEPLYDTMSEVELALALGNKLGEFYPGIKKSFDGIGGAYGDTAEGYTRVRTKSTWEKLPGGWEEFRQKGTVNTGPYSFRKEYGTPSKKVEFYSGNLKKLFTDKKVKDSDLDTYHIKARGDLVFVPHYQDPIFIGEEGEFPLILISYKNHLSQEGRSPNTPWSQEIYLSPLFGEGWKNLIEVNPETARKYGLADGDAAWIESPVGKIKAVIKAFEGVHPEVAAMCYGQGHWAYGKWSKDAGANPNEITGVMYEHVSGMAAFFNTRVKIYKV